MSKEEIWYFTFGVIHTIPKGYVKIHGSDSNARIAMFNKYGDDWGLQYTEEGFRGKPEKFNLRMVDEIFCESE